MKKTVHYNTKRMVAFVVLIGIFQFALGFAAVYFGAQ